MLARKTGLDIKTRDGSIFSVAELVSYLSKHRSLQPGDMISTGTPPVVGLGQKPLTYLKPGQTLPLSIEGLGVQRQRTVAE